MIKIDFKLNNKLKEEYLRYLCSSKFGNGVNAKNIIDKFNDYEELSSIYTLNEILFVEPCEMDSLIENIEKLKLDKNILQEIFKYESKFQPIVAKFIEKYLNPTVCYYCNIDFINVFDEQNSKNKFTLDHFYDKATYPFLALSIYNLIPSCYVCNSPKIKGSTPFYNNEKLKDKNPYSKHFDFDKKVKFKLNLHQNCKNLFIKTKDDIDIKLKERYTNDYDKYIEVFKLNERYEAHRDVVFDMIKNMELYPDSRLKELENLTGIPHLQIKQNIFNLIEDDNTLHKHPLSKLIKDISSELGI